MTESPITVGTCSLCGGPVQVPGGVWMSVIPPTPTCASCGAVAAQHGPVIPMHRPAERRVSETTNVPVMVGDRVFIGDASVRLPDGTPWVEVTYTDHGPKLF